MFLSQLAFMLSLSSTPALANSGPDAGMAVSVKGDVSSKPHRGKTAPLQEFTRVREGDRINIEEGGEVQILFYDSGRRETWSGPSVLEISKEGSSQVRGQGEQVGSEELGDHVGDSVQSLQVILSNAERERGGATLVRGLSGEAVSLSQAELDEIEMARTHYEQLRSEITEDSDIMPELYLASVLLTYDQREEAQTYLTMASEKCNNCEVSKLLMSWSQSE